VGGDAGEALLRFDQLEGFTHLFELARREQRFRGVARDMHARGSFVNRPGDLGVAAPGIEADLGNPFHFTAPLPVVEEVRVFLHDPGVDGGNAVGFGQLEGLADFGVGVIAARECGDVGQVAGVRPAADQVAAEHQAAEFLAADAARRQRRLRSGSAGGGRGWRRRVGLAAQSQRNAGGGDQGGLNEPSP